LQPPIEWFFYIDDYSNIHVQENLLHSSFLLLNNGMLLDRLSEYAFPVHHEN